MKLNKLKKPYWILIIVIITSSFLLNYLISKNQFRQEVEKLIFAIPSIKKSTNEIIINEKKYFSEEDITNRLFKMGDDVVPILKQSTQNINHPDIQNAVWEVSRRLINKNITQYQQIEKYLRYRKSLNKQIKESENCEPGKLCTAISFAGVTIDLETGESYDLWKEKEELVKKSDEVIPILKKISINNKELSETALETIKEIE